MKLECGSRVWSIPVMAPYQPIRLHFADEIPFDRTERGRKHLILFGNLVLGASALRP